ncbi:Subtilisin inhibitor-like [Nonomuraea maritima]|uniref:Subtilisin inhibitor-like n=1 Tax=Nonomuraea maritima TaxID=683260 RepID=A0A1G8VFT5_9ACTN|nr:SSI family serine proteinase inhibitor [Nonomuraea maritima]SDJ64951.1 Subtilisin inhibitor-like [Nonomuraea maritima]
MHMLVAIRRAVALALPAVAAAGLLAVPAQAAVAELDIVRHNVREGTFQRWFLTCPPDTSRHPHAEAACDLLTEVDGDLDWLATGSTGCSRELDPVHVNIRGTWRGRHKEFAHMYANACVLDRQAGPVVP